MSRWPFIMAVFLLCVSFLYGEAAAEERVLRLQTGKEGLATYAEYPPRRVYWDDRYSDTINKWTFAVYTTGEIDSKLSSVAAINAQDAKAIAELQGIVDHLRKNIKDLSDVNDALTRRVEELEKKLASR